MKKPADNKQSENSAYLNETKIFIKMVSKMNHLRGIGEFPYRPVSLKTYFSKRFLS